MDMDINEAQLQNSVKNDDYLAIWQVEQEHIRTRWNVTTFFMSVSFAIFGYSFQSGLAHPSAIAVRFTSLFIYWFAYILFLRYYKHTKFLRSYLIQMESSQRTTLDIQSQENKIRPSAIRTHHYLLGFGVIYTVSIALFWILGV